MTSRADARLVAIVQARMGSSRMPGKSLADLAGQPAVLRLLTRLAAAREPAEVHLACSTHERDDPLAEAVAAAGFAVFRGDEDDVLGRFHAVAVRAKADAVIRITGDCPLVDPEVVDRVAAAWRASTADFVSNTLQRTYPDGLDVEVFGCDVLERAHAEATHPFLRQHVTPYIHGRLRDRLPWGGFSTAQVVNPLGDFSHLRWTLDEPADRHLLSQVFSGLPGDCPWTEVVAFLTRRPDLFHVNRRIGLNEGTARDLDGATAPWRFDASNALFARAGQIIPLASQTFSKSHQQWVRGATPLFLDHGRGARIFDIDGNSYIDYVLGLLPVVLGYTDPDVDRAIIEQLEKGITFSLPHPLEAEVAERLRALIPCAEMVRFGKNGSDATTAAIRLARAHSGRDQVIVAGYHGWHDWYIGTTVRNLGVPEEVRRLSHTVPFNDLDAVADLLRAAPDRVAAVILEPAGTTAPRDGYLEGLRALCDRCGVVLIFDEIVTGFRINMGGAQREYGVTPDLACFGKAMANGMPVSAVVGRADIMRGMEDIFFSGTFGGETLSLAAAAATIDKLQAVDGVARLRALGGRLSDVATAAIAGAGLDGVLSITGMDWWPRLSIDAPPVDPWLLVSLMRQEFVARGLLLGASFNLCLAHDDPAVERDTSAAFASALAAVRDHLDAPDPAGRLRGARVQPTFAVRR